MNLVKSQYTPETDLRNIDFLPQLDVLLHHFWSGHVVYLADALGRDLFRKNGLFVNFARANHSPKVVTALHHDIFKIGAATATEVIRHAANGHAPGDNDARIIYQADQNYSSAFYSLANSYREKMGLPPYPEDITTPEDLIGKIVRTGGGTPTNLFWIMVHKRGLKDKVNSSLEDNGFQKDKINLTWIEEDDVKAYSNLMLHGKLDVYSKPTFGHGQFRGRAETQNPGLEYASFSTLDAGLPPVYGIAIVARKDFVEKHPNKVRAFLKAVDEGMKNCMQDPDFGVDVMNRVRGFGEPYYSIEKIKTDITVGKYPEFTGDKKFNHKGFFENEDTKKYGFGCVREEKLQQLIDMLDETGLLKRKIEPEEVYLEFDWKN